MAKKINVEKKARSDIYKGNDLFPSLAYNTSSFLSWMTCHASPVYCGTLLFLCALNQEDLLYWLYLDDTTLLNQLPLLCIKGSPKTVM